MAAVLFAFGTESLTAVEAVAGSILALAAYVAGLLLTRELSPAQVRALPQLARGALR
jgi:hypothetical protein